SVIPIATALLYSMSGPSSSKSPREPIVHDLEGYTNHFYSVAFSPDGKSVVYGSRDWTVRTWDAHITSPTGPPLKEHIDQVHSVSYSPLGDCVASGSDDGTICIWNTTSDQQAGGLLKNHKGVIFFGCFLSQR
ncbi:unnamed protein product, partial [Rhizoctonia solani]